VNRRDWYKPYAHYGADPKSVDATLKGLPMC